MTKTSATLQINGYEIEEKNLYLMDISYINSEFRKNHARQVDGVLGAQLADPFQPFFMHVFKIYEKYFLRYRVCLYRKFQYDVLQIDKFREL